MRAVLLPAIILSTLPLTAQEQEQEQLVPPTTQAPETAPPPVPGPPASNAPVDPVEQVEIVPITPVPIPEGLQMMPKGDADLPGQPKGIHLEAAPGVQARMDGEQNIFIDGSLKAVTDNGVVITASRGRSEGKSRKVFLDGSVHVNTHTGIEIYADHAEADPETTTITLTGNTAVYRGNLLQRGQQATYNWKTQKMDAEDLRAGVDPVILEGGKFTMEERDGKQVYVGHNAGITTHDVENPGFWLRASETTVYPEDKVTFKNLRLYAGDTPIFWLPYLSQPLDGNLGYHFIPGARSNWGAYVLNTYGILLGEEKDGAPPWMLSKWHFDLRSRRGVGTGVDLSDNRLKDNPNVTGLSLYYANDLDPGISRSGFTRGFVNEDRYRIALQHRIDLAWEPNADWRVDTNLNILSDQYYLEDFMPEAFRTDPSPDNTIGLFRRDDASLFSLYARVRPNEFYRSDTRLPEIAFDMARRPILGTSILHEGTTSLAFVSEGIGDTSIPTVRALLNLPDGDPRIPYLFNQLPTYERQLVQSLRGLPPGSPARSALMTRLFSPSYTRFNTYQELSRPFNVGGWLNLTPEVGVGYTRYSNVDGPSGSFDSLAFHAGAEASVKFSKDYGNDIQNRAIGLDGLMHVFQPYARYSYVATDDLDPNFPTVDRETFTTRPQTLAIPRFRATDSLRDWNMVRLGARNRLLTHRDGQTFEWLSMDTYFDAYITDPDYNRNFSNLYNDVRWNPLPWFGMNLETQFPVIDDGNGFSEVAARARFMPNENLEFSIGDRLLDNHPVLQDSHRIDLRTYMRLNEHWGLGLFQLWELDDGTLEIQQYTIHRDFNHWVASLGFTKQDNRVQNEYGVVLSFTLKDFPSASLPLKIDAGGGTEP